MDFFLYQTFLTGGIESTTGTTTNQLKHSLKHQMNENLITAHLESVNKHSENSKLKGQKQIN